MAIALEVPWMIGQGAKHPVESARLLAYAATAGGTGVCGIQDLKTVALPTPTGKVRVMPGAAFIRSTYPGCPAQSYMVRVPTAVDLPVPATGSAGGATYAVIAYVADPEHSAFVPNSKESGPFAFLDVVNVIDMPTFPHPYVKVGHVALPANTATVTQAMIMTGANVREMANPRVKTVVRTWNGSADAARQPRRWELTKTSAEYWPPMSDARYDVRVEVPYWATHCEVSLDVSNILVDGKDAVAHLWGRLYYDDTYFGDTQFSTLDAPNEGSTTAAQRLTVGIGSRVVVPGTMKGKSAKLRLVGYKSLGSSAGTGRIWLGDGAVIKWTVTFEESFDDDNF